MIQVLVTVGNHIPSNLYFCVVCLGVQTFSCHKETELFPSSYVSLWMIQCFNLCRFWDVLDPQEVLKFHIGLK